MGLFSKIESYYRAAKQNRWFRYFTVFNRVGLAAGFLPSGFVKIMGERFTSLSAHHPMGAYLEALHHTGYYYTFIGVLQVTAAVLLLIPRTALLGALIYFPIILNICILSHAVRFDGSLVSSPLMVLANLYLLCWDYDKLKLIFSFKKEKQENTTGKPSILNNKFPFGFFAGAFAAVALIILIVPNMYEIRPYNTLKDCRAQCEGSSNPKACEEFCDCIHKQGKQLDSCLNVYKKAKDADRKP